MMLGLLDKAGYKIVADESEADVIIVNTCGFIDKAKQESIDTILELARCKETGECRALIMTGCLAQRYGTELLQELPEVDAVVGSGEYDKIVEVVRQAVAGARPVRLGMPEFLYDHTVPRIRSTPSHTVYVKIAEGCDNRCSYCVIPDLRGRFRSRRLESIIEEAGILAEDGVKEAVLIAQDTTRYGLDLYGEHSLARLLGKIARIEGLVWIRIMYSYPTRFTDELIETIANETKICKYVDLPLQHADDEILKRMNRQGTQDDARRLIAKLRDRIPDVTVRSSFIVGFPGETDQHFQVLLDFLVEMELDRVGIFTYSREEGTPAARMSGRVPKKVKEERYARAMELQRSISRKKNEARIGKVLDVLVEGRSPESDWVTVGRSQAEAPEIDGLIYIGNEHPDPGEFRKVRIVEAGDYDLVGEIIT